MAADPDAESQSGDPENKQPSPPEVEAEIVDAEFSEHADAGTLYGEEDADRLASTAKEPAPARALSLRLMLAIGLGALALAALGLWLIQSVRTQRPAPPVAASAPEGPPLTSEETTAPVEAAAPLRPTPDAGKIVNETAGAKSAGAAISPSDNAGGRGLPPAMATSDGGNNSLQQSAKDALRALGGAQGADHAPDASDAEPEFGIEEAPAAPGADSALRRLQEEAEASVNAEVNGGLSPDNETGAASPRLAASKIANNVEMLKAQFDAENARLAAELANEKNRSAAQGREIASLRESLNDAISARVASNGFDLQEQAAKIRLNRDDVAIGRQTAASFALISMQQAIDAGNPYRDELDVLAGFAADAPGIAVLSASAAAGVPTLGVLKTEFEPTARAALSAWRLERASGLLGGLIARMQALVSVRPAGPRPGAAPGAVISRADASLAADDLSGAVAELGALEGGAREAFKPWLARAEARLAAQGALASLRSAFVGAPQN